MDLWAQATINAQNICRVRTTELCYDVEEFLNSFIDFLRIHHTHIYTQMTE